MGRKEYYDDPAAPTPNSLVPAATVFVQDDSGRVLMIQRSDNGLWSLPGGAMEIGESIAECGERETLEETGYRVRVNDVIGIYSDPKSVIEYDDGEVRQQFAVLLKAELVSGSLTTSDESLIVGWVDESEINEKPMSESTRIRIEDGYAKRRRSSLR